MPHGPEEHGPPAWDEYYRLDYSLPFIHEHLGHLAYFMAMVEAYAPGPLLAEAGTGTGLMAIYLSQKDYCLIGLDNDPGVLALNRQLSQRLGGKASWTQGDMFELPFPDQSIDLLYHQGLLEHFDPPDIGRALQEHARVAQRVIFTVPTLHWRGGLRGDERLWHGKVWHQLLSDFDVLDIFGSAYRGTALRALHALERRFPSARWKPLFRAMALRQAGEIGFVLTRR